MQSLYCFCRCLTSFLCSQKKKHANAISRRNARGAGLQTQASKPLGTLNSKISRLVTRGISIKTLRIPATASISAVHSRISRSTCLSSRICDHYMIGLRGASGPAFDSTLFAITSNHVLGFALADGFLRQKIAQLQGMRGGS